MNPTLRTLHTLVPTDVLFQIIMADTFRVLFVWRRLSSTSFSSLKELFFFVLSFISTNSLPIAKVIIVIERNIYSSTLTSGRGL